MRLIQRTRANGIEEEQKLKTNKDGWGIDVGQQFLVTVRHVMALENVTKFADLEMNWIIYSGKHSQKQ